MIDIVITDTEHAALGDDQAIFRGIVSTVTHGIIGLGAFAGPFDRTDDDGNVTGTEWRTSFPADLAIGGRPPRPLDEVLEIADDLVAALAWCGQKRNRTKLASLIDEVTAARRRPTDDDDQPPPAVDDDQIRDRFAAARGVAVTPSRARV